MAVHRLSASIRALTKGRQQKNFFSSCYLITLNCVPSLVSVLFDTPDILLSPAHVQIRILSTKMFLTLNFYVQVEG
jgi:hypothetical protein